MLLTDAADRPPAPSSSRPGRGVARRPGAAGGTDLVVTSPGWRPDAPLLADAAAPRRRGRSARSSWPGGCAARPAGAAPWLALTGTNGKTTTVRMLESILLAAGQRAVAAGNVGRPLVDRDRGRRAGRPPTTCSPSSCPASSCTGRSSIAPAAAALLNLAADHLDWHGSFAAYADAKARIWGGAPVAVANADDPVARRAGRRRSAPGRVTLGEPAPGQLGVRAGALVDRAFAADPAGELLLDLADVRLPGPHNVANALAAAALARAAGVPAEAVGRGLAGFRAGAHRNVLVGDVDGVDYVDDSKATNPHAAGASLAAYPRVVWIAGGLLKGATSTRWSPRSPAGWPGWCSWAATAPRSPPRSRDTPRRSPW